MNNIKKIIEYGLYLLVFLLPIQTRWIIKPGELNGGYWEYGTISLYGTDIVLLIILLCFVVSIFKRQNFQFFPPQRDPAKAVAIFPATAGPRQGGGNFQTNPKSKIQNFWFYIALLDLAIIVSIFFAPSRPLAVYSYIRFLLGVGLFWLIVSAKYDKIKLIWSLIAGAAIQAGLGIWQFLTQSSFAFKWLGIAEHKPFDLGTSVVEVMGYDGIWERWLRAYGGLDHPNMLGGFLAIALLLLVALYTDKRPEECGNSNKIFNSQFSIFKSPPQRDPAHNKKNIVAGQFSIFNSQIVFLFSCFLVFLSALFFTFSRGAWAGFVTGLIVMLVILLWQKNKQAMKKALELIFAGAIIILFLFNLYSNLVLTRLSKDTRLEIKSNTERLESYKYAKEIIKDNWFFGVGMGNYTLYNANLRMECESTNCEYANKSPNPAFKGGDQPSYFYQPVHNTFLLVWAETGILGLVGFLGLLGYLIIFNFKKIGNWKLEIGNSGYNYSNKVINKNSILSLPILSALIIIMLVDHWWWSLHFGVLFWWLLLGLMLKQEA